MMRVTLLSALFFFITVQTSAQKFDMGKVTVEELKQTEHPKDPKAEAAVLYKKGRTYFEFHPDKGFRTITEVETRIKIYKKEGYDWANLSLIIM